MNESPGKLAPPSFLWPGIIAASLGVIGYFMYAPPLTTRRPTGPTMEVAGRANGSDSTLTAYARLWEDPLGPVYRESARQGKGDSESDEDAVRDFEIHFDGVPLIMPVLVSGGPGPDPKETRMRMRYAVIAALTTAKYRPDSSGKMKHLDVGICSSSDAPTACDRWIVPYERFVHDVTDPLYDHHDDPRFPEVLVCWLDQERLADRALDRLRGLLTTLCSKTNLMDVQRQEERDKARNGEESPSSKLLVHAVGPSGTDGLLSMAEENDRILKKWGAEFFKLRNAGDPSHNVQDIEVAVEIYSPRATVEPAALRNFIENKAKDFTGRPTRVPTSLDGDAKQAPCVGFQSVAGTDWHLAHALREELKIRDHWPRPHVPNESVVLLTEKDTAYGRALPYLFWKIRPREEASITLEASANASGRLEWKVVKPSERGGLPSMLIADDLKLVYSAGRFELQSERFKQPLQILGQRRRRGDYSGPEKGEDSEWKTGTSEWDVAWDEGRKRRYGRIRVSANGGRGEWRLAEPFVVYKYLRGIDGKSSSPGDSDKGTRTGTTARRAGDDSRHTDEETGSNPTGNSQRDYLRRLEEELVQLHARQRTAGGRGILAIGVVGTDVYDKLLILRALRRRFPRVWFFATDLDAEFVRPCELRFTRNLIVASHFGLTLHPSLQRDVPPFRDSYQTATYLATLMAVKDDRVQAVMRTMRSERAKHGEPDLNLWPVPVIHPHDLIALKDRLQKEKEKARERGEEEQGQEVHYPEWLDGDPWKQVGLDLEGWNEEKDEFEAHAFADALRRSYLRPLVFEIGRDSPYQLTMTTKGETGKADARLPPSAANVPLPTLEDGLSALIHPPSPREVRRFSTPEWFLVVLVLIASAALLSLTWTAARKFFAPVVKAASFLARLVLAFLWFLLVDCIPAAVRGLRGQRPGETVTGTDELNFRERFKDKLDFAGGRLFDPRGRPVWLWHVSIVLGITLALGLFFLIRMEHRGYSDWCPGWLSGYCGGEPFELCEGISVWPSTVIRMLAAALAFVFVAAGMRDLRKDALELFGRQCEPNLSLARAFLESPAAVLKRIRVFDWKQIESSPDEDRTELLLDEYSFKGAWWACIVRYSTWSLLYVAIAFSLFCLMDDFPNSPARSPVARAIAGVFLVASVFCMVLLVFFVIDATNLCRRLVSFLGKEAHRWSAATYEALDSCPSGEREDFDELISVRVIARRTNVVGKLLYYPFVVVLLMIVARHTMFDGWNMPLPLVAILLLVFLMLVVQSATLRREAANARFRVLTRLKDKLPKLFSEKDHEGRQKQLQHFIREIERERNGAFRSLTEDHLFRALAILFGGSGLLVLQQLLPTIW